MRLDAAGVDAAFRRRNAARFVERGSDAEFIWRLTSNSMPESIEQINQIRNKIETIEEILPLLPADLRDTYGKLVEKLREGLKSIEDLARSGRIDEAFETARDVLDLVRTKRTPRETIEYAVGTFGPLISTIAPPLTVVESILRLGVQLSGRAYDLWKARVLRKAFSPAAIPLVVQDANTGFSILMKSPVFGRVFHEELRANDRPFLRDIVRRYIEDGDVDWLRDAYGDRFESEAEFALGASEFNSAATDIVMRQIDGELRDHADAPASTAPIDYGRLTTAIDRLRADPEAAAALDDLVALVDELRRGEHPTGPSAESSSIEDPP